MSLEVLYEDNHLLAVNKPPGIACQGDQTGDIHLLDLVEEYIVKKYNKPGKAFVGLIHRIDRPVSGVVLLAKTSKGLERMNELFRLRQIDKVYHALTHQALEFEEGTLTNYIDKNSQINKAIVYNKEKPGSKLAILHYKLLSVINGIYQYRVVLETGRFHQVRSQFAKAGSPLIGDVKYGYRDANFDKSVCLHAKSLTFIHPVTKQKVSIHAPYPVLDVWKKFESKNR